MSEVLVEKKSIFMNELAVCLQKLRGKSSLDVRSEATEKICQQYNEGIFNESETKIVSEILDLLSQDIEVSIRRSLAENLKNSTKLPREIALRLAKDVEDVALPILEFSFVLTDEDLIEIIKSTKDVARHRAIAKRSSVSYRVVDELIRETDELVVRTVIANKGAYISNRSLEKIVHDFKNSENILGELIERGGLSLTLVEEMISTVSERLKEQIILRYDVSSKILNSLVDASAEENILKSASFDIKRNQVDKLVSHINEKSKLNYSIIMRSLCKGDLEFFVSSLSTLANVPRSNTNKLVYDPSQLGFTAIYKAAKLPDNMLEAAKLILKFVIEAKQSGVTNDIMAQRICNRIVTGGFDKSIANMRYFMTLINTGTSSSGSTIH